MVGVKITNLIVSYILYKGKIIPSCSIKKIYSWYPQNYDENIEEKLTEKKSNIIY